MSSTLLVRRPGVRGYFWLSLTSILLTLAGCGSGSNTGTGINSSVGTSSGVSITSASGETSLLAGETLALTAAVTNDTNNAGVSWVLDGDGSLSNVTTTTATYNAPASVAGTSTPIITATSIASSAQLAAATLIVNGTPVIDAAPLFPANVGVAYAASVIANGGKSPYVWELTAGALPDGMTKAGNTIFYESLTGTPTVTGSFPITLKVTDANGATSSVNLTLVVNAASSCLISGRYALLVNGITGGTSPITRAAALSIDGAGAITGIGDRKTNSATNASESLTGTCTIRVANSGELQLKLTSESPNFNYSVIGNLTEARLQLSNGGDSTAATGHLYQQTPAAFSLASIAGSYAFGTLGAESDDRRVGLIGQFSVNASGVVSAGRVDSNGASPITAATVTGTMSAPDANGRGTLTLAGSGVNYSFAYYVLNTGKLLLINVDSATTAARLTGFATRRVATSFTASALTGNGVFSLWGWAAGLAQPRTVLSLGRLSGGNALSGAISLLIDSAVRDVQLASVNASAASYAVEADGRVTLNATISGAARSFTLYLDAANDGYLIERNAGTGNAGLLEAQMNGPFNRTLPGIWVAGTQFPQSSAPIALLPSTYITNGSLSASSSSGFVAISPTTGRGLGTIATSGLNQANMAFYVVQPNRALLLRYGDPNQNGTIDWYVN